MHLCRREPERGDEALEASPDPGRAVGDEEPMAQEANRPMFLLKPADGAIGAHQRTTRGHAVQQAARRALLGRSGPRSVAIRSSGGS